VGERAGLIQSLFLGTIETELLKPFPTYSNEKREEIRAVVDMVKRFTQEQIDPAAIDRNHQIPDSVKKGMGELGLWGITIPEEYGGFAQPDVTYNKVMEVLTGVCGSTSVTYGAHLSIGLKAILLFGTDEQKREFLPALAAGEQFAAFALTEPGAGSDNLSMTTIAEESEDGSYYILNGRKQWITNGGFAHVFTIFARVKKYGEAHADASKITAFIVMRNMPGFSSGKEEDKLGLCGSSTTPLYLDNVRVPAKNILGQIGGGFKIAMEVLNTGRLGLGAGCVGTAKAIIQPAVNFALQREQFGSKIADFDMIKEKFARCLVNTFTSESMVYCTTCLKELPDISIALEAAACKIFSSEALWQTVNDCLQIAGGNGYMKEYPFERFLRDTRINMIFEGTNEILRMMIATTGLMKPSIHLKKHLNEIASLSGEAREKRIEELVQEYVPSVEHYAVSGYSPQLEEQVTLVSRLTQQFQQAVVRTVLRQGRNIRRKEIIQRRITDAAIDLYGMYANCARVENLIRNNHYSVENALMMSRIFAFEAERRIRASLVSLDMNCDADIEKAAELLYEIEKYPFDILDY